MPRRTNPFQHLVALIQQALVGNKAKITESAMVPTEMLPYEREIDVLIESGTSPHRAKIAVEAKDHARKLDVDHIDEIIGKYNGPGRVSVNKVVLVSHSGFTPFAYDKASLVGIDPVTLSDIEAANWPQMLLPPTSLMQGFQLGPYPKDISVAPVPSELTLATVLKDTMIRCDCNKCNGKELGSLWVCAVNRVNNCLAREPTFNQALGFIKGRSGGSFDFKYKEKPQHWVATCGRFQWHINTFSFTAHARWATGEMKFKHYAMNGSTIEPKLVQHGTFTGAGYEFELVFADNGDLSASTMHLSETSRCKRRRKGGVMKEPNERLSAS